MTPIWDQHACLPLDPDADVTVLRSYAQPAGAYVCVNVGYTPQSLDDVLALINGYSQSVRRTPNLVVATTPAAIDSALADRQIAVGFDLEDSAPLAGDLANVVRIAEAGVTSMIPTYNHANAAGCGSLDTVDTGLTHWGRDLITELNTNEVLVDGSHCSEQTGIDISRAATRPMIYSHTCLRSIWDHPRNITNDQARACFSPN